MSGEREAAADCGQEIHVIDPWGSLVTVLVELRGTYMAVVNHPEWRDRADAPFRNGQRLCGWEPLLDRFVWLAAHPAVEGVPYQVRRAAPPYLAVQLAPQVKAPELAGILGVAPDEVQGRLDGYIAAGG